MYVSYFEISTYSCVCVCASRIFEFVLVCLFSHTNDLKITVHVLMVADFTHCRCSYVVCVVCQCDSVLTCVE